jgi:hypothetical protein
MVRERRHSLLPPGRTKGEKGEGSDVFSGLRVVALGIALQEDRGGRDCDHPHTGYYRNKLFLLFSCFPPFSFGSHQVEKLVTARVLGCERRAKSERSRGRGTQTLASLSRLIGNYGIVVISFVQVRNPY